MRIDRWWVNSDQSGSGPQDAVVSMTKIIYFEFRPYAANLTSPTFKLTTWRELYTLLFLASKPTLSYAICAQYTLAFPSINIAGLPAPSLSNPTAYVSHCLLQFPTRSFKGANHLSSLDKLGVLRLCLPLSLCLSEN